MKKMMMKIMTRKIKTQSHALVVPGEPGVAFDIEVVRLRDRKKDHLKVKS